MDNLYYWLDTTDDGESGYWCMGAGPNPQVREFVLGSSLNVVKLAVENMMSPFRLHQPPKGYSDALTIGEGHQFRYEPVRHLTWDREGTHGVQGAICGVLPWIGPLAISIGILNGGVFHMGMALAMFLCFGVGSVGAWLCTKLFITYQGFERESINDFSYRDIGGFLTGMMGSSVGGCVVMSVAGYLLSMVSG